jgi:hypothetical protein
MIARYTNNRDEKEIVLITPLTAVLDGTETE